jgi:hypothetical protein
MMRLGSRGRRCVLGAVLGVAVVALGAEPVLASSRADATWKGGTGRNPNGALWSATSNCVGG